MFSEKPFFISILLLKINFPVRLKIFMTVGEFILKFEDIVIFSKEGFGYILILLLKLFSRPTRFTVVVSEPKQLFASRTCTLKGAVLIGVLDGVVSPVFHS